MRKKIGLVLVALLLVFTLTACSAEEGSAEERAFAAYMTWMEHIGSVGEPPSGAWDADFVMDMDMRFFGMIFHTITTGTSQAIVNGDHITMYMNMDMDMGMPGVPTMNMEMFMEMDGFTLIDMVMLADGQHIPGLMDEMDDAFSALETMESMNQVPEFLLDDIVEVELYEGAGYAVFTIIVDREAVSEFMNQSLEQAYAMLDEFGMDFDFGTEDLVLILTADEAGEPLAVTINMSMEMVFDEDFEEEELAGQSFSIRSSITYTYNAFGDDVVVVRPEAPEQPELPETSDEPEEAEEPEESETQEPEQQAAETLEGTWMWMGMPYYVLQADGRGTMAGSDIRWSTSGGVLSICSTPDMCGDTCIAPMEWRYVFAGNELTLTSTIMDDMTYVYTRG